MTTLNLTNNFLRESATVVEASRCSHCQTPVPAGLLRAGSAEQFCCEGCRTVYSMIRSCGLQDYYRLRAQSDGEGKPIESLNKGFEEFDDPAFHQLYCTGIEGGLLQVDLLLENVHCGACVWLVEKLPAILPAVKEARLDFGKQIVRLTWDPQHGEGGRLSTIARKLASLGYPPHPARGRSERQQRQVEDRAHLIRIAVAGAIAGNVMIISFALYGGMFHGMEPMYERLFHWTSLLLMAITVLGPGRVFFRGALAAWRSGRMHMDVPISIGLAAGSIWSAINAARGSSEIYFDSLSVLVFLLLLGRWIQLRQQRRSRDAVELLFSMTPSTARLVEELNTEDTESTKTTEKEIGTNHPEFSLPSVLSVPFVLANSPKVREIPVQALCAGQIVEVRAGESIPVDGVIVRGHSTIDASLLTGESVGVKVTRGERVHAGTVNLGAALYIKAESIGEATRLGKLMHLVEESASRRAPVVRLADRIAGIFVIAVLVLSLITVAMWLWLEPSQAMKNAMALLIVTCPCALGMATPLAIIASIGRAARHGILIRGGEVVEQLNKPGLLLLDKTGTITQGAMSIVHWTGPQWLQPIASQIESHSSHPLAIAFTKAHTATHSCTISDVHEITGAGIAAMVDGKRITIGSRRFLEQQGMAVSHSLRTMESELASRAVTPVLIAVNDEAQAIAGIGDPIKPDAAHTIEQLQRAGWKIGILSGDDEEVVKAVAAQVGVDVRNCRGRATPEEKLAIVRHELQHQPVVMVGDGVNDAAALAAATVGVAVKGGAEASFAAADVYLNKPGLEPLEALIHGSRRTFGVIRRNLAVSLLYNVLGVGLAMAGCLNPLIAAVMMPFSSLSVITLSYRSRTFGGS